ncbi:two pore domain potassium channel family protein [Halopseudomonas laoshanensis]|uniref:Two pore domain potassium channel family protein n=1 Tax=Halopseudomonas laoshanensis TaxID=2268758 RepID=A0A7V7GNW2_9GAMM|nr:ion channel [Halopseudomonas laoshanensis]KAA0691342.1 two pore domain potassium channel family protein [Halopseudomonas laoshanensis]
MLNQAHVIAFGVTLITAVMAVMLHYESFILFDRLVGKLTLSHRRRMLLLIFGLLFVHVIAIWGFGISAWWLVEVNSAGVVMGYEAMSFFDYIFMSAVTYTTLGYGDMIPLGPIRFLYGTQGLVGFVLITCSASFAFLEMQRNWNKRD